MRIATPSLAKNAPPKTRSSRSTAPWSIACRPAECERHNDDRRRDHSHAEPGPASRRRSLPAAKGRPTATCIYFLLRDTEASHWHRVDAAELWLYHAGAPLFLALAATDTGP